MRYLTVLLAFLLFSVLTQAQSLSAFKGQNPKALVVLIPGTWNSLIPGNIRRNPISKQLEVNSYFSLDVVNTWVRNGYAVIIVNGLLPFGDFSVNASIVQQKVHNWYFKNFPKADIPITFLGHSAGGFYALKAAEKSRHLPIRNIILLATPLHGSPVADVLFESGPFSQRLRRALEKASDCIDFQGALHLTSLSVRRFLKALRIPDGIKIFATAGSQRPLRFPDYWLDARRLSPLFSITSKVIPEANDGVVPLSSAYGVGLRLRYTSGETVPIKRLTKIQCHLDHSEQFLDYRIFKLMGFTRMNDIRQEQIWFYESLIQQLPTQVHSN
ncbi:lipase family protein [Bdellovibrio reynosensis]|uniref:Alpha/beta hydrolase n=1 Tax=Bdellovibrio reynosensis TaxID=2835041 RepID=A0ABY4CDT6_9BACT|nr:hypothetical protein [Bdellovibrio reynosensis]UOF01901.1 hypothetical protein MNR06_02895 [Bdellovibrio reynosensis]